jgi:hypothetical protein
MSVENFKWAVVSSGEVSFSDIFTGVIDGFYQLLGFTNPIFYFCNIPSKLSEIRNINIMIFIKFVIYFSIWNIVFSLYSIIKLIQIKRSIKDRVSFCHQVHLHSQKSVTNICHLFRSNFQYGHHKASLTGIHIWCYLISLWSLLDIVGNIILTWHRLWRQTNCSRKLWPRLVIVGQRKSFFFLTLIP